VVTTWFAPARETAARPTRTSTKYTPKAEKTRWFPAKDPQ
jgi:hypothetical protein